MKTTALIAGLLVAGACVDVDVDVDDVVDGGDPAPPALEEGVVVITTPDGVRRMRYQVIDGHAIVQDDIDLGPIAQLQGVLFGGAIHRDLGRRWPHGEVRFRFDASVSDATRDAIDDAHDTIEDQTPIRFIYIGGNETGNYVEYRQETRDGGLKGRSSSIGMQGPFFGFGIGSGEQVITLYLPSDADDEDAPHEKIIIHEMLHALGMFHEHARPDRDDWIHVRNECITAGDRDEFEFRADAVGRGLYDFESIMHYATGAACLKPEPPTCGYDVPQPDGETRHVCDTMYRVSNGLSIGSTNKMSREDVNMLWRMYGEKLGIGEVGDGFGGAVAVGDFDDDGYQDVAVGVPGENGGAGAVHVLRGTSERLVPWQHLDQDDLPDMRAEAGDQFGFALYAADVDRKGGDDLLIGAPGEDLPGGADAGLVVLLLGAERGLTWSRTYTQSDDAMGTDEAGDRFGAAVAAESLAVGSPWQGTVIIGAPGERNDTRTSGAVFLAVERRSASCTVACSLRQKLFDAGAGAGSSFGAALAVGILAGQPALAVGAPDQFGRGAVHVYTGQPPVISGTGPNASFAVAGARLLAPSIAADDFGTAVAIGNLRGDPLSGAELVVGAPGTDADTGDVHVYSVAQAPIVQSSMVYSQQIRQNSPEFGDRFGAALAIDDLVDGGGDDLAAGAPGEDGGEGAVTVFRGNPGDATSWRSFRHNGFGGQFDEPEDGFGAVLATGNLDGVGDNRSSDDFGDAGLEAVDLVIGLPGEGMDIGTNEFAVGAGAIGVLRGDDANLVPTRTYFQDSATRD